MKAMSALALAAVGLAGVVAAQTTGQYPAEKMQNPPSHRSGTNAAFDTTTEVTASMSGGGLCRRR